MKSEWITVRAADFIDFNPRLSIEKNSLATKVSMDKLRPFTKRIPETEIAVFSGGAKFSNGDTIMARITPCLENGKTAFVDILKDGEIAFGSTEFIVLRSIAGVSDPQFVYYLATSPSFRSVAIRSMVGSSGRQRVQQGVLNELELIVPPLAVQHEIGTFLAKIDKKISLNVQINDNLQRQAQVLYKAWFVDFDPFGGVCPDGWRTYHLSDFLPVITGRKNANISSNHGQYPFFSCSQDYAWTDGYSFEGDAILVAGNGDFNVKFYSGKFEAYQRTYVLIPYEPQYTAWLFYAVQFHLASITAAARGSVIKFITKGNLENFEFVAPQNPMSLPVLHAFDAINRQIATNNEENKQLAKLRDTFLPKLMAGEIDLSEV